MAKINTLQCKSAAGNLYRPDCDFQFKEADLFLVARDSSVNLSADPTEQDILDLIAEQRLFPIHVVQLLENNSADPVTEETNGEEFVIKEGEYRFRFAAEVVPCTYGAFKSFESNRLKVWYVDTAGRIGSVIDQTEMELTGVPSRISIEKQPLTSDGTTTPRYVFRLYHNAEKLSSREFGYVSPSIAIDWANIDGLTVVDFLDVVGTTSNVTFTPVKACGQTSIFGLEQDDILILDDTGAPVTITGLTEVNGVYIASATLTAGDYTIQMNAPTAQTSKIYISGDPVAFTV